MGSKLYDKYIRNFDINLLDCKLLGKGHNGIVYMLPEGKVIKVCYEVKSCRNEYSILRRVNKNKYFPRVYGMTGNYMIRDYVDGVTLSNYIKKHGLSREIAKKVILLLEEFKKLNFSKEDIRCKDIMVQPNGSLMVIDPKKFYTKRRDFPRHLVKGLYDRGVLEFFMSVLEEERPNLYRQWNDKIEHYVKEKFNIESHKLNK